MTHSWGVDRRASSTLASCDARPRRIGTTATAGTLFRDWEPERKRCGAEDSTKTTMGRKRRPEHVEVRIVRMHGKKVKEKRVVEIVSNGAADLVNEIEAALNDLNAEQNEPTQTEE